jgi:hypothetical protein
MGTLDRKGKAGDASKIPVIPSHWSWRHNWERPCCSSKEGNYRQRSPTAHRSTKGSKQGPYRRSQNRCLFLGQGGGNPRKAKKVYDRILKRSYRPG